MKTVTITPEVKDILKRSSFGADRITLPKEPLPRDQYNAVMKVLDAQGGKWSRKEKCHIFTIDPRSVFENAMETGEVVHAKKTRQAFYTPEAVVNTVMAYAAPEKGHRVLEPSAGDGAFADAIAARGTSVTCVEIDDEAVWVLMHKGYEVLGVDFLALRPEGFAFDMIIMNPPFTKGQDISHVTHALSFLKESGQLFAIVATSYISNPSRKYQAFRELMDEKGCILERFDNHEFRESGTDVSTILIKMVR